MQKSNLKTETLLSGRWVKGRWVRQKNDLSGSFSAEDFLSKLENRRVAPGILIPSRIEWGVYATLVLLALAMRLYDLGGRAVHHDESLHGYFAYQMFIGGGYDHNPLMHGMFLFHSIATSFFLFGDNEFSMRLPMALFGAGLVLVPLILKPRIGQIGSLACAILLAFSPSLIYYSRFARNDIFMAVFTIALVGVMWRYIDERKNRWLYLGAAIIALGFTTKETQYIVIAVLGSYLLTQVWGELKEWLYARRSLSEFSPAASFFVLITVLSLPLLAASVAIFQNTLGITLAAEDGIPGIVTGSPNGVGWNVAIGLGASFLAASLGLGWFWKRTVFLAAFAVFAFIFVMIFSNFGSYPAGVGSGSWQSLGYWIAQQDVARGNQPWYYYFILGSVYEFLPLTIALVAVVYYGFKSGFRPLISIALITLGFIVLANDNLSFQNGLVKGEERDVLTNVGHLSLLIVYGSFIALPFTLKISRFNRFLIFWIIGTFIAYIHAGEKMPWLLVNLVIPVIVFAGSTMNDVVSAIRWREAWNNFGGLCLIGVPVSYLLIWKLLFNDLASSTNQFLTTWMIFASLGFLILGFQVFSQRIGKAQSIAIIGLVSILVLFGFTFRAGWIANYENGDVPEEILVYTQTSPDIHNLAKEIERTAALTGDRTAIKIAIDTRDAYQWPWQWYLRRYTDVSYSDHSSDKAVVGEDRLIVVVNEHNNAKLITKLPDGFSEGRRLVHRWWFPERYRDLKPGEFFATLVDRNRWKGPVDYFMYRELSNPLGSIDSYVYFSDEIPIAQAE
tara:strand:+ start:66 stop:2426 length:2361 start_codon:yes stop_codon:yes gene_type:complete